MSQSDSYSFASEYYIVEKTVEVVVQIKGKSSRDFIRIEALHSREGHYQTRSYVLWDGKIEAVYPDSSTTPLQQVSFWIDYDLPWTRRDTADGAINQALAFLSERCEDQ